MVLVALVVLLWVLCQLILLPRTFRGVPNWSRKANPLSTSILEYLKLYNWVVVSYSFYFHPYLGRWSNLTTVIFFEYTPGSLTVRPWKFTASWKLAFFFGAPKGQLLRLSSYEKLRYVKDCTSTLVWVYVNRCPKSFKNDRGLEDADEKIGRNLLIPELGASIFCIANLQFHASLWSSHIKSYTNYSNWSG